MSSRDELVPLEGEREIPPLTPPRSGSHLKPVIAVGLLMLSLVGVLGFAATRYFNKKDVPIEATADVASATATRLKFQDPSPRTAPSIASPQAAEATAVRNDVRVPSIEMDDAPQTAAIPVRTTTGGAPQKRVVAVGDESPFGAFGAAAGPQQNATDIPPPPGIAGDAQAVDFHPEVIH